ncbi:MAG: hypothetical protein AAF941_01205 [Pseudomonadota bacterium]
MTEVFRQKLLDWFVSVLLLLTAISAMLLIFWFLRAPLAEDSPYMTRGAWVAVMAAEVIVFYAVFFPSILIWHLFDFAERARNRQPGRLARFIASHKLLVVTMGLSQIGAILSLTGRFHWNSCDDLPPGVLPHSCQVRVEPWIMALIFIPLLFSIILCMGKAAIMIRSRLRLSS